MANKPDLKAETDFKDLLRKPGKLFGYSYLYFVFILGGLGYLYVDNLTVIGKNSISPVVLKDSTAFVQDIPFRRPSILPPVDVMKVSVFTPELLQKGKELFNANCSSCHGDNGEGNGSASVTLNPKPRNFHQLAGWKNGSKISQIYKTLQDGVPGSAMASFNYLPPSDRFALIHYIRSLSAGQSSDSPEELQGLETTYQLSKGTNTPGQIPVKKAVQILDEEVAPEVAKITVLARSLQGQTESAGLRVFQRVAHDRSRILSGLLSGGTSSLQTMDQFIRVVSAEPTQLGFKAEVVQLSASEWTALYQFLIELKARRG